MDRVCKDEGRRMVTPLDRPWIRSPWRRGTVRAWVCGVMLLGISGCWAGPNAAATGEYARQVSTATLRVSQLEAEIARSQQRIEQLEEVIRIQGQSEASRLENIDQVNAEVMRLRGQNELLQFQLDELRESLESLQVDQERRFAHAERRLHQVEGFLGVKPPPPPTDEELGIASGEGDGSDDGDAASDEDEAQTEAEAAEQAAADLPDTITGKLDRAVEHMEAGRQAVARAILNKALEDHPDADEVDEVRYRYAETFLNEEKWRPAILEFKKVIDNHPDSQWACWSYYRQGEAMEKLTSLNDARVFYSGATQGACRSSEAAKAARKKL